MVKFKEFKVGDLFTDFIVGNQPDHSNRFDKKEDGMFPVITGVTLNNGVGFYSYKEKAKLYKNILTISKDGEYAGTLFIQKQDVILGGHSLGLYNEDTSSEGLLYIMGCLNKYQREGYWKQGGVMGSVTLKLITELPISLPVTSDGTPDYSYMETYIKEMQREYIDSVLEANSIERNRLLSIVGLDQAEYERVKGNIALEDAESYGEFKVVNLYDDIQRGKRLTKADRVSGGIPLVTAGEEHYGIAEYIENHSVLNKRNSVTIDMFGNVFPRNYEYFSDDNIISLNNEKFTDNINIYIVGALQKIGQSYNYSNQFRMKSLETTKIRLPITQAGEVDYAYMEDYISKIKLIYIYTIGNYLLTNK